jgi:hypothetical protein
MSVRKPSMPRMLGTSGVRRGPPENSTPGTSRSVSAIDEGLMVSISSWPMTVTMPG